MACRVYLALALVAAAIFTLTFYTVVAVLLLILEVYTIYKPPRPSLNLSLILTILLVLPLVYEPVVGPFLAPFTLIPGLPLLDNTLKRQPRERVRAFNPGRRLTTMTKSIMVALVAMLLVSIIALNPALALASAMVAFYFIAVLVYFLAKAGKTPLKASPIEIRSVAGERGEVRADIQSKVPMPVGITFGTPYTWASLDPGVTTIDGKITVKVAARPLLSGPGQVPIHASIVDPWGLVQIGQELGPVELHVIPRAKYAEWLAKKFLDQSAAEAVSSSIVVPPMTSGKRGGGKVEYYGSRGYRPGDRLKDINWKQSLKLNDLVVKDYSEPQWQQGVLLVNLTAGDAEEADIVISAFISSALTMARESMMAVIAAYNHESVLEVSRPLGPRDTVKRALDLAEQIVLLPPTQRFLQPQEVVRLRRTISQLERVGTDSSQKLSDILSVEYKAMHETTRDHPLSALFIDAQRHISPPATVTVVSTWNHDFEALSVTADRLRQAGYNVVFVSAKGLPKSPPQRSYDQMSTSHATY